MTSSGSLGREYRGHRLDIQDDGSAGWTILVHPPASGARPDRLHVGLRAGLRCLLAEAERRIDRKLDGEVGSRRRPSGIGAPAALRLVPPRS